MTKFLENASQVLIRNADAYPNVMALAVIYHAYLECWWESRNEWGKHFKDGRMLGPDEIFVTNLEKKLLESGNILLDEFNKKQKDEDSLTLEKFLEHLIGRKLNN